MTTTTFQSVKPHVYIQGTLSLHLYFRLLFLMLILNTVTHSSSCRSKRPSPSTWHMLFTLTSSRRHMEEGSRREGTLPPLTAVNAMMDSRSETFSIFTFIHRVVVPQIPSPLPTQCTVPQNPPPIPPCHAPFPSAPHHSYIQGVEKYLDRSTAPGLDQEKAEGVLEQERRPTRKSQHLHLFLSRSVILFHIKTYRALISIG